ncbi:hypothetical protein D9M70_465400 [compost metagenome]
MPGDVVVHGQCLAQHEQVLLAPVARQGLGDLLGAGLDAAVAVPGQYLGVALAGDDGADDGLAGLPHDVAEHLGELEVHLHQRFLHALHPTGLLDEQHLALTGYGPHHTDVAIGAPGRAQQPQAHQPLQPLAVLHVALAPGYVLELPRIDQPHRQAMLFQHLVDGDPVHPGGLQCYRVHPQGYQPVSQRVEVIGHRADFANRLAVGLLGQMLRHRHPVA